MTSYYFHFKSIWYGVLCSYALDVRYISIWSSWSTNHLRYLFKKKDDIVTYFQFWCSWRHWSDQRWSQTQSLASHRHKPVPTLPGKAEIEDQILINKSFKKYSFYPYLTLHDGLHSLSPLHFFDVRLDVHRPHVLFILKSKYIYWYSMCSRCGLINTYCHK